MYFSSISELLNMGGHGIFVWASYAITLFSIISIMAWTKWQHRKLKALLQELQSSTQSALPPSSTSLESQP